MELWHGSQKIIETPQLGLGKVHNDYGQGFYCTESLDLAREWACSRDADGFANRYELDMADLKVLDLLSPQYSVLHWIALLVEHRSFRKDTAVAVVACEYLRDHFLPDANAYDVIRGWRADDSYFSYARAFVNNTITVDQLGRAMRLGTLENRLCSKASARLRAFVLLDLNVRHKLNMAHWPRTEMSWQGRSIGNCLPKTRLREFVSSISFERG